MSEYHPDLSRAVWKKSSRSSPESNNCVEVAQVSGNVIAVQDSNAPHHPPLILTREEWQAFTAHVKRGRFDIT
jgi:hypothetical protein